MPLYRLVLLLFGPRIRDSLQLTASSCLLKKALSPVLLGIVFSCVCMCIMHYTHVVRLGLPGAEHQQMSAFWRQFDTWDSIPEPFFHDFIHHPSRYYGSLVTIYVRLAGLYELVSREADWPTSRGCKWAKRRKKIIKRSHWAKQFITVYYYPI